MRPTDPTRRGGHLAIRSMPWGSSEAVGGSLVDHSDWVRWEGNDEEEEDERAKSEALSIVAARIMDRNFSKHLRFMRAAHVKSHGFVKGTLTVSPSLPPHLQHGLFSTPGHKFTTIGRYSSESSHVLSDVDRGIRGFGLKVLGVKGERIGGGDTVGTQDLLFNNSRTSELYCLDAALEIFILRERYFDDPDGLELALRSRDDAEIVFSARNHENTHMVANKCYMQTPIRIGPYVAKLSLLPSSAPQLAIAAKARPLPPSADSTAHQKLLRAYFHAYPASYILRAQFASASHRYSINNTSIPWDAPWIELGSLEFPVQESYSDRRRVWFEETLALSPWNGLVAHQPLGSLNRARRKVYEDSRRLRATKNVELVQLDVPPESIPD